MRTVVEVGGDEHHREFRLVGRDGGELGDVAAVGDVDGGVYGRGDVAHAAGAFLLREGGGGVVEALFRAVEAIVASELVLTAGAEEQRPVAVGQDDVLVVGGVGTLVVGHNPLILLLGVVAVGV